MFRGSRWFVSNVLMLMVLAIGVLAAAPRGAYAAPARQSNEVMIKLTAAGVEAPEKIGGGVVTFAVENAGAEPGQSLSIYRLKEGKTFEDFRTAAQQGFEAIIPLIFASGGLISTPPGGTVRLTIDMRAGMHVLAANAEKAQFTALEVSAPAGATMPEPAADVNVTLRDFEIVMPNSLTPGAHTFKVTNVGPSVHHLIYARLLPGKRAADLLAGGPEGPPPIDVMTVGGIEALDITQRGWVPGDLQPGTYVAVCFIPDEATGKPHAALGMLREFTVGTAAGPGNLPATGEAPVPVALPDTGTSGTSLLLLMAALALFVLGATLRLARRA